MINIPDDGTNPTPMPIPMDKAKEVEDEIERQENLMYSLQARDEWDLIKKYFKRQKDHYIKELGGFDLANADLKQVGEKYLVCALVAAEFDAFINWIESTARAVKERKTATKRVRKSA